MYSYCVNKTLNNMLFGKSNKIYNILYININCKIACGRLMVLTQKSNIESIFAMMVFQYVGGTLMGDHML